MRAYTSRISPTTPIPNPVVRIIPAIVAMLLLALAPASALAHAGHDHLEDPATEAALAELEELHDVAPQAPGVECAATIDVPGQGPSCARPDGAWQVDVGGRDLLTHGPDAPGSGAAYVLENWDATQQAVVAGASASDARCATNIHQPHYRAIYARPSDAGYNASRPGQLRTELYKASAYMNLEATRDNAGRSVRLRLACTAGLADVDVVQLGTPAAATTFSTIVNDLRALGYPAVPTANANFVVFYDGNVEWWAGQAQTSYDDQSGIANGANSRGRIAANYTSPHWPVLLHEILHNLGAVQVAAPESSGAGHCTVDADIMCYQDTSGIPTSPRCTYTELDCGGDTYFNAGAPGGWLASHWNLASPNNLRLDHGAASIDGTAPTAPPNAACAGTNATTVTCSWDASEDDVGVTGYRIQRFVSGAWQQTGIQAGRTVSFTGLSPSTGVTMRVQGRDAAGNLSTEVQRGASSLPDTTAPSTPAAPTLDAATETSITIEWADTADDVAVTSYRVLVESTSNPGVWTQVATRPAATRSYTLTGLTPSSSRRFRVQALDAASNASAQGAIAQLASLDDTTPPAQVVGLGHGWVQPTTLNLYWNRPADAGGIDEYLLERELGGVWSEFVRHDTEDVTIASLAYSTEYVLRVVAIDHAGNRGTASQPYTVTTAAEIPTNPGGGDPIVNPNPNPVPPTFVPPTFVLPTVQQPVVVQPAVPVKPTPVKDTTPPPAITGQKVLKRTRNSAQVQWNASRDDRALRHYRVYVKVGRRWVLRTTVKQPRSVRVKPSAWIRGLRPRTTYLVAIDALDMAGNATARKQIRVRTL